MPDPLRVVIGEDDVLFREGIARILTEAGFEVAGGAGDADGFLRKAIAQRADVAVVDVKMPPNRTDDGLRAAVELRRRRPETSVLVLSNYYEPRLALDHAERAVTELRELAHGILPATLSRGLGAAIETLVSARVCPCPRT